MKDSITAKRGDLSARVSRGMREKLETESAKRGLSISAIIRELLTLHYGEQLNKNKTKG